MIKPSELVNALVEALRSIGDLVGSVDNNYERIYAYVDSYPRQSSLALAIHNMPVPSIMAVYVATQPAGTMTIWRHSIDLYIRAHGDIDSYSSIFRLILKAAPSGKSNGLTVEQLLDSVEAMNIPGIYRQTDSEGLDYFKIPLSFNEIGDD